MMRKIITYQYIILCFLCLTQAAYADEPNVPFKIVEGVDNPLLKQTMEQNIITVLNAFNACANQQGKSLKVSKDCLTDDARENLKEIWEGSPMTCPRLMILARCLKTASGFQIRGIPVDITAAANEERRQELTFDLLPNGRISNISIAIEMHRYEQLMAERSSDIDYARRQKIISFIEDFRTAYNRRDMKVLTSVFSDKALIITGRVIKEKPNSDMTRMRLNNNKVVYIKQSKQEYLTNLAKVFKTTRFINVSFDDIEIVQHPKYDMIYGVTLRQHWHTNRYQDEGYLFLMIDFTNEDNPLIQVRTWQPYKDGAGNIITQQDDIFHLGSFKLER